MLKSRTTIATLAIATALAALCSPSFAAVVDYQGMGLNQKVRIHAPGTLADGKKVQAGEMKLSIDGHETIKGWCVDLDHWAGDGEATVEPLSFIQNGDLAAWLHATYSGGTSSEQAAALASAIWEVTHENDGLFDLTSGSFSISGNDGVLAAGNAMLAGMPASWNAPAGYGVLHLESAQDFLVFSPEAVPEPGTMILLSMGGLAAFARRRRQMT